MWVHQRFLVKGRLCYRHSAYEQSYPVAVDFDYAYPAQDTWVVHQICCKQEGHPLRPVYRRGPFQLVYLQVYDHQGLYQLHGYVDSGGVGPYARLEFLSNTDQDMGGRAVRRDRTAVPRVEKNYDNLAMKRRRLSVGLAV